MMSIFLRLPQYFLSHTFWNRIYLRFPRSWPTGNIRCELRSSSVSTSSSTAISTEVSIAKDLDGIAVQDSLIIASVQNTLSDRVHVSPSFPSSTMRARSTAISKLPSLNLNDSRQKPRVKQPWELDIPPSPRTPPPHPPNTPPASESVTRVLDPDCPPPAKFAFLPSASSLTAGETEMWIQKMLPPSPSPSPRRLPKLPTSLGASPVPNPSSVAAPATETAPPTIPPRSKLRPPPVKITTNFRPIPQTSRTPNEAVPLHSASPAHSHSSSIASLTISPLDSPPMHSHSSSVASLLISPSLPTAIAFPFIFCRIIRGVFGAYYPRSIRIPLLLRRRS
ncbi:hypothetical protein DFH06DRAFT_125977 [Mycena polygramma]|nr:hypothetical protein DFH06DRAFT_125977 [Mycena polygramma]